MDWVSIGGRIRRQREFLGYTREQFAELLDVTPKFCSDIELGVNGFHPFWQGEHREFQPHHAAAP